MGGRQVVDLIASTANARDHVVGDEWVIWPWGATAASGNTYTCAPDSCRSPIPLAEVDRLLDEVDLAGRVQPVP